MHGPSLAMRLAVCLGFLLPFLATSLTTLGTSVYRPGTGDPLLEPWRWVHYPELDGQWVMSMTEAQDGAMWFRTRTGVTRYDGVRWQSFSTQDGLLDNQVRVLCGSRDGSIYAGTESGLCRFQGGKWQTLWPAPGAGPCRILCMTEDPGGSLWFGTYYGLARMSPEMIIFFSAATNCSILGRSAPNARTIPLPEGRHLEGAVYSAMVDKAGSIWAATTESVFRLGGNLSEGTSLEWDAYTKEDGLDLADHVSSIVQTADGTIWTIDDSGNSGINQFDGRRWTSLRLSRQFGGDDIYNSVLETRDGVCWVSGFGRLFAFAENRWRSYEAEDLPLSQDRFCIRETSRGDLWIAGRDSETWRVDYSGRRWRTYPGLHFHGETPDGKRWYLTREGAVVVEEPRTDSWVRFGAEDGLIDCPTGLMITQAGDVWIGGSHQGVPATAQFNGSAWARREHPELVYPVGYRSMFEARDGTLWLGCEPGPWLQGNRGGLLRLRRQQDGGEQWTHFGPEQSMSFFCVGIGQTADNMLWVGGLDLTRLDGDRKLNTTVPKELEDRWIDDVYGAQDGQLWLSVGGVGAFCLRGTNWTKYTTDQGLANNMVSAIRCLHDGTVLAANAKGISRFDGRSWTPFALPSALHIDREGGTLRQSSDRAIWVNMTTRSWYQRGITKTPLSDRDNALFRTTRYQPSHQVPVTRFLVSPGVVSQPGNAFLSWEGFAPWHATPPENIEYSFRLNEQQWSPFSRATSHYYQQMKSGHHRFQVRARDSDFNVESMPAAVAFIVLPPVWQQGWFLALLGTGGSGLVLLLVLVIRRDREILASSVKLSAVNQSLASEMEEHRCARLQLEERTCRLENEVEERKRVEQEKDRIHKELISASRRAGMADVASSLLHNVGNVLNSVNVSVSVILDRLHRSKESAVTKVAQLLGEHTADLDHFMVHDEKGRALPHYLEQLGQRLTEDRGEVVEEVTALGRNVDHIKEIIALQQRYGRAGGVFELISPQEVMEDALRIHAEAFHTPDIIMEREYATVAPFLLDRHKVTQILVSLLSNAKQACDAGPGPKKRIVVRVAPRADGGVRMEVADNGVGIAPENLTRIFVQGFTTRAAGHGYGLHSSALAAIEMGGTLQAHSGGLEQGARFTLDLPGRQKPDGSSNGEEPGLGAQQ